MSNTSLIAFTQALVRQPSVSGEEGPVVSLIAAEMRALGFDEVWIDEKGNVVGLINGAHAGPTLLLDGHCDTVGIAPGIPWSHDPFGAEIEGNFIYGRGVSDMKGGLAAMVYAAAAVDRSQLAGRLAVTGSVMEENIEGLALKAVMDTLQPAFVIIGEATDLNLVRAGRGRAELHLQTLGRPAHSSSPQLGKNAVLDMMKVISAVEEMPLDSDPVCGPGIMVLTDIISDPYPAYSVIPSRCRVTYDRRLLPGETQEGVLGEIEALPGLEGVELQATIAPCEHTTYTGALLAGQKFSPAWLLAEDEPLVQTALHGLRVAGLTPALAAYQFCTNAAYSAGTAGIPTVGFGPGREDQAHVIDERLELDALFAARDGYRGMIEAILHSGR